MSAGAVLVLDQSLSSTGFALMPVDSGPITSGAWPLCDGIATRALGFRTLFHHLDALHKAHGLGLIAHEAPVKARLDKVDKLIALYGLVAVIELFAASRSISVRSYGAGAWRGTWFSKAERAAMRKRDWKRPAIERARQFGFDPVTHDEAEAIAILDHHLLKHKITPQWRTGSPMLEPVAESLDAQE